MRRLSERKDEVGVKKRIVKTLIWSTVLYATETWTLRKVDIPRLESIEMWIWRRLMKISWTEHRSNQEVLHMVDENRSLMNTIRQRQNWLGHVLRSESLLRTVVEGRMEGTRTRGRQSATMIDCMKSNDMEYEQIKKRDYDREDWCHWSPGPA